MQLGSTRSDGEGRRRRILVMPEWYPWPDRPGYGSFCRDQAVAVSRGHDVIVVAWAADPELSRPFALSDDEEDGLRTFRVRVRPSSLPKLEMAEKVLAVMAGLHRLRREGWSANVVHAHEYAVGPLATLAATMLRAPLVVSERSTALALGLLPERELACARRVFRAADVVCPDSEDLGFRLRPLAPSTLIRPVPNPVDTALFAPGPREDRTDVRLLIVGNLIERKGHRHLLDALGLLHERGARMSLDIVGDGELRRPLEAQARASGIASAVRFRGHMDKHGVARMMQAADVLVLASSWENLPCVLIEAMASGLPVVGTRVGGTGEIIDDSSGELVEPGSANALADAIARVAKARDAYDPARMHQTATRRYSYEAVARALNEVYELGVSHRTAGRKREPSSAGSPR
jgi:glycosyltransferase involved in cell wall biosynthesis